MIRMIRFVLMASLITGMVTGCAHPFWEMNAPYPEGGQPAGETSVNGAGVQGVAQTPPSDYRKVDRLPPSYAKQRKGCVKDDQGQEVCGYDCKISHGVAKCADQDNQECVVAPSGQINCGYDCKTTSSQAKCGKYLYDNCVTNAYGDVRCGNNCTVRAEDGEIVCGK